jgi:hypothetical protein
LGAELWEVIVVKIDWLEESQKPDEGLKLHADLKQNQRYAKTFMEGVKPHLEEGMILCLGGPTPLPESLLWVKYSPPKGIPEADYGYPVNLNGPHSEVKATVEWYFNAYHKIAKRVIQKYSQPKVMELRAAI